MDEKDPSRRVLVLGARHRAKEVSSFEWDRLPGSLNVADFDVVVVDLTPFDKQELAHGIKIDTLPAPDQFARLMFSPGSELIVVGSPNVRLGDNPYVDPKMWFPLFPKIVIESGQGIREIDDQFASYFRYVKRWSFHVSEPFEATFDIPSYLSAVEPQANAVLPGLKALASTRFGTAIGFQMVFVASYEAAATPRFSVMSHASQPESKVLKVGSAIWLPPPTEVSATEAIDVLLSERFGVDLGHPEPDWAGEFNLPAETEPEREVAGVEEAIRRDTAALEELRAQLHEVRRFRGLLYQTGEALESLVRDALGLLGASVAEPLVKGREDGRATDPAGRGWILEIKGRTGQVRLTDVRELDQWVGDAVIHEGWTGRGLLIANTFCETPPHERDEPFPPNCLEAATARGHSLLTTTQLFRALCDLQQDDIRSDEFWDALNGSRGVVALPGL